MYHRADESTDVDVIIVGAGLAGMTAAYTLFEKIPDLSVLVLEANGRFENEKQGYLSADSSQIGLEEDC